MQRLKRNGVPIKKECRFLVLRQMKWNKIYKVFMEVRGYAEKNIRYNTVFDGVWNVICYFFAMVGIYSRYNYGNSRRTAFVWKMVLNINVGIKKTPNIVVES